MTNKQIKDLNPVQAWEMIQHTANAVLIDVRSRMEFEYVGHPVGAINIVWKEPPDWRVNPDFSAQFEKVLAEELQRPPQDTTILTICRSGKRSREAAENLAEHGFTNLFNIAEGFEGERDGNKHRGTLNGWRFHGLPWEQS